ncbi:MAG: hypothetical protein R3B48_03340 [Kofleriaceae bacterium]
MSSRAVLVSTLALGASALLSSACKKDAAPKLEPTEQTALVNCAGINECKGKSACHTATHACAGQNSCKGDGWIDVTAEECAAKSGTVVYVTRKKP